MNAIETLKTWAEGKMTQEGFKFKFIWQSDCLAYYVAVNGKAASVVTVSATTRRVSHYCSLTQAIKYSRNFVPDLAAGLRGAKDWANQSRAK